MKRKQNVDPRRLTALLLAASLSAGMLGTTALAENATPEAAMATMQEATAESAAGEGSTDAADAFDARTKAAVINIGATADSINVVWYGSVPTGGQLKYGTDQAKTTTVAASVAPTSSAGWYKNTVTLTGLEPNTTYQYAISADKDEKHFEAFKTYTTKDYGADKDYSFLVFGDPQIGSSKSNENDTKGWLNTLDKSLTNFPQVNFLFSMGDQVDAYYNYDGSNLAAVEEQYDDFLSAPQLANIALATEVGNHDCGYNTTLYGEHYTLPNVSEKYGQLSGDAYGDNPINSETNADGDYYFTYNNTLFMVLNSSCLSIAEHKAFLEETLAANPDATWNVVSFHKSIYSVASHVTEADIVTLRNGLSPVLKSLGIDVVLQGHDHVYARSYIMGGESGMTADVKKTADGKALTTITNPDGVQYLTFNSASGSKFYKITQEAFEYTAVQNQEKVPNYSLAQVTDTDFTVTTYRSSDDSVVDTITIHKDAAPTPTAKPTAAPTAAPDKNAQLTAFVTRLYQICLERKPDAKGLTGWVNDLASGKNTAKQTVAGFVYSAEFTGKNYDATAYVTHLYNAFMGREPDAEGLANWVNALNAKALTRDQVFDSFAASAEFAKITASYGVK